MGEQIGDRIEPVPMVRVVVLNWNNDWFTTRCVRSLLATDYPSDRLQVVVVDNGSVDGSLARLRHDLPGVEFVENGANLGFAEGCNRALRDLTGIDHVALINNDAIVEPDWLRPLVDVLEATPEVGAAAPKMLLETPFVTVEVEMADTELIEADLLAGPRIAEVRVDGLDVTNRCLFEQVLIRVHPTRPLDVIRLLSGAATLHVPIGPPSGQGYRIEVDLCGTLEGASVSLEGVTRMVTATGDTTVALDCIGPGHRRINNLGTEITATTEAADRWFGVVDRDDLPNHVVAGFCGGAVLLRVAMLQQVGLFDPRFFAYYEDTDLAWRACRAGWTTECVPRSVVHHLHGGSGGARAKGVFFVNHRNWLVTVMRNGSPRDIVRSWRWAWHLSWPYVRHNLLGEPARGRRPKFAITLTWTRVLAGVLERTPAVLRTRRGGGVNRGGLIGEVATDAVWSRWQPRGTIPQPRRRPGGPTLVYVDVTNTLSSGWRAGIQRVTCALIRELPAVDDRVQLVVIRWDPAHHRFRRVTSAEYQSIFEPTVDQQPQRPPAARTGLAAIARDIAKGAGADRVVGIVRRAQGRRRTPSVEKSLFLDRFEPGSIFFDVDAGWNAGTADRTALLAQLAASGVSVVSFIQDIFPLEHPEWFGTPLVKVFDDFVRAHVGLDSLTLCPSTATAESLHRWAKSGGVGASTAVVPLGVDAPEPRDLVAGSERPFVLIVGTVEPRKNHSVLLDALEELWGQGLEVDLVVAGRAGWQDDGTASRLRAVAHADRIRWATDVSDDELHDLYSTARVVVVPSHSEGFGLSVVEALARGAVVVASESGSLPEVGGAAAWYFDPTSSSELASILRLLVGDEATFAERRVIAAAHRVRTWTDCATEVADVLVRVGRGETMWKESN